MIALLLTAAPAGGQLVPFNVGAPLWYEASTPHFHIYTCGSSREVFRLGGRLEQYCRAYAQLAGPEAVDSPPIAVLAFPNHGSMTPYLPVYEGRPANMAAFFHHGADENLIVLSLTAPGQVEPDLQVIFHEYSHLLFRRNDRIWPLWLKEGMAEIYSTFATAGKTVRIANPIPWHVAILRQEPMLPLRELFAVRTDSPQYNERNRQGVFYAEAWLLTHYLMAGDNPQYRARFGQFTTRLRAGEEAIPAFTNALQSPLEVVQANLRNYLARGVFDWMELSMGTNVASPVNIATRRLSPAEVYYRLGDELLRIRRWADAAHQFEQAKTLAPRSPLPEEGLGLLAHEEGRHEEAREHLERAVQLGSDNFLAYYLCAYEELRAQSQDGEHYHPVTVGPAADIRSKLERSIELMPNFGPAQEFFGFFEMVQGDNTADAGRFLQRAVELEPENLGYLLILAQYQLRMNDPKDARRTLQPLLRPGIEAELRSQAGQLMREVEKREQQQ